MKSKWLFLAGAVAATAFSTAQATMISGYIDMSGTASLDTMYLSTATKVNSFSSVTIGGTPTGSFAGTSGSVTWYGPMAFSGASVSPLWEFISGGWTYRFDLANDSVVSHSSSFLNLVGSGTLSITGMLSPYTPTTGNWSFTISNPTPGVAHTSFQFTFANSQVAVPDGGMTAMLLGLALGGFAFFSRKLARA